MTEMYMATIPKWIKPLGHWEPSKVNFRTIREYFEKTDVKEWVIALEKGKKGYEHYQVRFKSCETLQKIRSTYPFSYGYTVEASSWCDYERKEGKFIQWNDTTEIRKVRFGTLTRKQELILKELEYQTVRQITVWYDPDGNAGKSWFCNWLYETGRGFYVPPELKTAKEIGQFVASGYNNEGIIVIDIPRTLKWSKDLYIAIENLKDGLVFDCRYHARTRNIRGCKVLVMTNEMPKLDRLSKDRWVICEDDDHGGFWWV